MCNDCRQSPCHPLCPNAPDPPEPKVLCCCDECGLDITEDDDYVYINEKNLNYHLNCLSNMEGYQIADLFDVDIIYGSEE